MLTGGLRLRFPQTARMLIIEGYPSMRRTCIATTAINAWAIPLDVFAIELNRRFLFGAGLGIDYLHAL